MIFRLVEFFHSHTGHKVCYNAYNFAVAYVLTTCIRVEQWAVGKLTLGEIFGHWDWEKQAEETFFYLFRLLLGYLFIAYIQKVGWAKKYRHWFKKDKKDDSDGTSV